MSFAIPPDESPARDPVTGEYRFTNEHDSLFAFLHGHIDEVLEEWRLLVQEEPWASLAPARLVNALPEMVPRLLKLADAGATHIDLDFSEFIARAHGYFRREDNVPLGALAEEWNHLKRAAWRVLRRHHHDEERVRVALARLDALIDDAIGFSLRGYYSPELDTLRGRGLERRTLTGDRRSGATNRRDS